VLEAEQLSKTFVPPSGPLRFLVRGATRVPVHALRDVTFAVGAGTVLGLVGRNGAGKSTLTRILATLLEPSSGRCAVDGLDVVREAPGVRARIGTWFADQRGMYWRLSGRENLELFGALAGLGRHAAARRAAVLLEELGLADAGDSLVFGYSTGMRARLGVGLALLADPPVLLLDEPANGLDPPSARDLCARIRSLAAQDRTVLLCSNRMDEVLAAADVIAVLANGRLVGFWDKDDLVKRAAAQDRAPADVLTDALDAEQL